MGKRPPHPPAAAPERLGDLLPDVVPLAAPARVERPRPRVAPLARQRQQDEQRALAESLAELPVWDVDTENGEDLVYRRDGLSTQVVRRLRRGHWVVQDAIDLHGHTVEEARAAVAAFLHACLRRGVRCVRIVHGKGLRSKNREPVLKNKVGHWLRQRREVLAYCQARPVDGGGGAVIVLLQPARR